LFFATAYIIKASHTRQTKETKTAIQGAVYRRHRNTHTKTEKQKLNKKATLLTDHNTNSNCEETIAQNPPTEIAANKACTRKKQSTGLLSTQ